MLARLVPEDQVEAAVTKVTPDESLLADPRGDLAIIEQPLDWLGEDASWPTGDVSPSRSAAALPAATSAR